MNVTTIVRRTQRPARIDYSQRVCLLAAGDEARRRVARDLHDGAQQRLVQTMLTLKVAQEALADNEGTAESFIGEALKHIEQANVELRELAHGMLPRSLTSAPSEPVSTRS
jgi:signal transduction histidine kinase